MTSVAVGAARLPHPGPSPARRPTVSVVLPALDEQATVAAVVESVLPSLGGWVDEVVVVDSGSTDRTVEVARAAGARVVTREGALPGVPVRPGKGEVLWRSLACTTGELVVFIDTDLVDPDPGYVPALLAPLLADPALLLVKAHYRRPLVGAAGVDPDGGGRVTRLVARPLLAALAPGLAGLRQPLSGEYAARREFLEAVPFAPGYGVEIGLVLDAHRRGGAAAIGEVELGTRAHRNRPLHELAPMSREIVATVFARLGLPDSGVGLPERARVDDRPPMRELRGAGVVPDPRLFGSTAGVT